MPRFSCGIFYTTKEAAVGNHAKVIDLFSHKAARARNQTNLSRIESILDAVVKQGRVALSVYAPGAGLTEEWLTSLRVDVMLGSDRIHCSGTIERLDHEQPHEEGFYLLVSSRLDPLPVDSASIVGDVAIRVNLRSACGTFSIDDYVVKTAHAT